MFRGEVDKAKCRINHHLTENVNGGMAENELMIILVGLKLDFERRNCICLTVPFMKLDKGAE